MGRALGGVGVEEEYTVQPCSLQSNSATLPWPGFFFLGGAAGTGVLHASFSATNCRQKEKKRFWGEGEGGGVNDHHQMHE